MKNLSNIKNSTTYVLSNNTTKINSCTTVVDLYNLVLELFIKNHINTTASNRLLNNIKNSNNITKAQFTVYNSILAGNDLAVIK